MQKTRHYDDMTKDTTRPVILFIAHAPSDNTARLRDAVVETITTETDVTLMTLSPFDCDAEHALKADGIIIATTENIGAMAGATKDFFDRSYNDLLEITAGKPVAVYIRAGLDGTGTHRGLETILTGLRWRLACPIAILKGSWDEGFIDKACETGLTLAAGVELGAL